MAPAKTSVARRAAARRNSVFDLSTMPLREVNRLLHETKDGDFLIRNPRGLHAIACGLDGDLNIVVDGHAGYYCAGMNKRATVTINGNAGTGVAENMMSGLVHVKGDASQSAGATGCGGLLVIDGNASSRCGISLRGTRHRGEGLGRTYVRLHGAGRKHRGARRCGGCARRFHLRGAAFRAR